MRCLFCKQDSSNSKSVEHIIPESLGNTTSILPKGVICDKCNNYFARKVEQPFMESIDILTLRFREAIPDKRGLVPPINGFSYGGIPVKVYNPFPGIPFFARKEKIIAIDAEPTDITKILKQGRIITPAFVDDMIPLNIDTYSLYSLPYQSIAIYQSSINTIKSLLFHLNFSPCFLNSDVCISGNKEKPTQISDCLFNWRNRNYGVFTFWWVW
ncbi:HNH endonuclease [Clostridium sp. KNHs216]|uniref:HNH endonuclease n=1 Tax=Clostridium sp. KNHs216 TaxID=1550235 RepID=UPI00114FD551|nr:HNH endonuclease [Clostridium sp. KNHs216]TQI66816.1 HNH endonuclease [Clostridium sp. KNHs216]